MFESEFLGVHLLTFAPFESKLPTLTRLPSESREFLPSPVRGNFSSSDYCNNRRLKMYFIRALRIYSFHLREDKGKQ